MINDRINPEDDLLILLPASKIPDKSTVSKRTGEQTYTLCRDILVYGAPTEDKRPLKIEGYFLVGERGSINQITQDTRLHWHVGAEELVDTLRVSWDERELGQ